MGRELHLAVAPFFVADPAAPRLDPRPGPNGPSSPMTLAEVQRLATIREAVALETEALQRLHKIDIAATSLDQLVQDYDAKRQA